MGVPFCSRSYAGGHNLLGAVGGVVSAISQLAIVVPAHGPQAAVALEKQAVITSCGNGRYAAAHNLFGAVGGVVSTVSQWASGIVTHGPETPVALEKKAVAASPGN